MKERGRIILVTGAGGKTGKAIIGKLSKVESVCALAFRQEQVPVLQALGADNVIIGDLLDEAAILSAMQGVKSVYHICPNMHPQEYEIGRVVIGAARAAGVEHFVYHSVLHPQTQKMDHHWQKLRVEEALFESGLPFTILQPAPYMQNLLAGWDNIVADGILRVPYSVYALFSFVDLEDVAEAATIVLTEPGHTNATYELAGTQLLSHAEAAEIFSRVLEIPVRAEKEEPDAWRLRVEQRLSVYAVENLTKMFAYYDQWGLAGNPNVLRWLLRREPVSLTAFIERTVKERDAIH